MRLEALELRRLDMPLRAPFRSASGTQDHRDVLLVRVRAEEGEGWGECVAMNEPLYSPEWAGGAELVIEEHLWPRLAARSGSVSVQEVAGVLSAVKGHPMAKSALEMALLDAQLSASGTSLASYLGSTRDRVPAGVAVGVDRDVGALVKEVSGFVDAGYRRVKVKVHPGWDVEPLGALRSEFSDDLALTADANGSYADSDYETVVALDRFGLQLIEQPLADDDIAGHVELARRMTTPLCLDETVTSARAAADLLDIGACSVVNLKPGRVGGYLEARRVHDVCVSRGADLWCGGMLETGIGRAANIALASLPGFTLTGDLSESSRFWDQDLTEPVVMVDGHLVVPDAPGIGVSPLPEVLARFTVSSKVLRVER